MTLELYRLKYKTNTVCVWSNSVVVRLTALGNIPMMFLVVHAHCHDADETKTVQLGHVCGLRRSHDQYATVAGRLGRKLPSILAIHGRSVADQHTLSG